MTDAEFIAVCVTVGTIAAVCIFGVTQFFVPFKPEKNKYDCWWLHETNGAVRVEAFDIEEASKKAAELFQRPAEEIRVTRVWGSY